MGLEDDSLNLLGPPADFQGQNAAKPKVSTSKASELSVDVARWGVGGREGSTVFRGAWKNIKMTRLRAGKCN